MIIAENLTKYFPPSRAGSPAVRGVDLEIQPGSIVGLYGDEPSGPSVLARLLGLAERPDSGAVLIDGVNTTRVDERALREIRRQLSVVDPAYLLLGERTAAGNVATPLEQLGVDGPRRRQKVADLLDLIGLSRAGASLPGVLSEGQRRRVAIARALATEPAVLIVDNPTAGLDDEQAAGVLATLDRARAELGVTVIIATTDASVVGRVCDSVAVLDGGALVESGTVLSLLADSSSRIARELLPAVDTAPTSGFDTVADVVLVGHAAVHSLIESAAERIDVEVDRIAGDVVRVAETPVARYRIGLSGDNADIALAWIAERGAVVTELQPATVGRRRELVAA